MAADNTTGADIAQLPSPEQIICILKKEGVAKDTYEIFSFEQKEQDGKSSFTLHRSSHVKGEDDKALQTLIDDFQVAGAPAHLQSGPQRRVHVVVSVRSGTGLSAQFYENVLAPLLEALGLSASGEDPGQKASYHLLVTQDAESVKNFAKDLAVRDRAETGVEHTVVLLSGDGGVIDMLNGYASESADITSSSPPLIAILPLGTGNALFNSLHKKATTPASSDLVQGLRTLLRGTAAPLPSFKAVFPTGSRTITYSETGDNSTTASTPSLGEQAEYITHLYGVVVASYGFHSQLVWESDTPEYRKHGAKRFQMVAEELLKESHAYRATVEIAQSSPATGGGKMMKKLDRDLHAYILATTVSNLEKTFCISPASQPLDGQLRLVHFGPADGKKTMDIMMAAYDGGKHIGMDGVGYEEMDEIRITTHEEDARWRKVCIDGTIVEIPAGGCMVVEKEARRHLGVLV
ncbi:ATP-NAD kinase-like domain-containing protein [Xylaria bambusicola]|uniref:ATP-NAD kinase-like domain-containing protein n=1 Tax=Xylaria bambusicola TaxID=326684 RepID=UPI002008E9D0|nr:ATP-NAD kinase-like domain-containing protein [Xylaria bambusicola]KAI0508556.1 ATP-NAD kinase-like domain-containing protein [Xylaria bambusicola]